MRIRFSIGLVLLATTFFAASIAVWLFVADVMDVRSRLETSKRFTRNFIETFGGSEWNEQELSVLKESTYWSLQEPRITSVVAVNSPVRLFVNFVSAQTINANVCIVLDDGSVHKHVPNKENHFMNQMLGKEQVRFSFEIEIDPAEFSDMLEGTESIHLEVDGRKVSNSYPIHRFF